MEDGNNVKVGDDVTVGGGELENAIKKTFSDGLYDGAFEPSLDGAIEGLGASSGRSVGIFIHDSLALYSLSLQNVSYLVHNSLFSP